MLAFLSIRRQYVSLFIAFLLLFLLLISVPFADTISVTSDEVSLRILPDGRSEIVGKVSRGETLELSGEENGDWLRVVPPPHVKLWVYSGLVEEGAVLVPKLLVRSGPGTSYRHVGQINGGTKLVIKGRQGDWLLIEPPRGCHVWINRAFTAQRMNESIETAVTRERRSVVENEADPVRRDELQEPAHEHRVIHDHVRVQDDFSTSDRRDVPGEPQKKVKRQKAPSESEVYSGILMSAAWIPGRPSLYRLVQRNAKGRLKFSCYLINRETSLRPYLGAYIKISGRAFWVQGVREAVVTVHEILDGK